MGKCTYGTVLGRKIMMTILLQVTGQYGLVLWYTFVLRELSCLRFDQGINKRDSPILLITFWQWILYLDLYCFIWSRKSCLWACCWMTQVSSTNLYQNLGDERCRPKGISLKMLHICIGYYHADQWPHSYCFNLIVELILKREVYYVDRTPEVQWCSVLIIQFGYSKCHPVPTNPLLC